MGEWEGSAIYMTFVVLGVGTIYAYNGFIHIVEPSYNYLSNGAVALFCELTPVA